MSLIAVLVAGIAYFVLGIIWYSEAVFGKQWMKMTGVKEMKPTLVKLVAGLVISVIPAYVLAGLIGMMGTVTLMSGLLAGLLAWLGFVGTLSLAPVLWEKKPLNLYLLNNAYNLVSFLLMGAIIALM